MKEYVIVPAYNEKTHLAKVIKDIKKFSKNIVIVDDGSTDKTYSVATKTTATVLRHIINLGKGAALKTGTAYAIRQGAEAIVFIDSDGQHAPKHIPELLKGLRDTDVVFTYRNLRSVHMPLTKKFGNFVLNTLLRILFGIKIGDTQCGYKVMTKKAYNRLNLMSNDYNIESEIVAKTGKYGLKFRQMPIETIYNDKYKGTTVLDGAGIALRMLWWKFSR